MRRFLVLALAALSSACGGSKSSAREGCPAAAQLVYAIDDGNRLLRLDPTRIGSGGDPFSLVGILTCPAAAPLGGLSPPATPASVAIDRNATAWVLYTSGELFQVSTADASCRSTPFAVGQGGFELFGMAFASAAVGSADETLYVAGGPVTRSGLGALGAIDTSSYRVREIGNLPVGAGTLALTGTGDARLYAFLAGDGSTASQELQVDTSSAQTLDPHAVDAFAGGTPVAWAFAQFGGRFLVFESHLDAGSAVVSRVLQLDPATGGVSVQLQSSGHVIEAAAVSTCAPSSVP